MYQQLPENKMAAEITISWHLYLQQILIGWFGFMVRYATFNNISVISW
jgi:hypothetical protein